MHTEEILLICTDYLQWKSLFLKVTTLVPKFWQCENVIQSLKSFHKVRKQWDLLKSADKRAMIQQHACPHVNRLGCRPWKRGLLLLLPLKDDKVSLMVCPSMNWQYTKCRVSQRHPRGPHHSTKWEPIVHATLTSL